MNEFLEKLKEYNSFVTGFYFIVEIRENGFIALKYKYPMLPAKQVFSFDTPEDFLSIDCLSVINATGFGLVKDK